MKIKKAFSLADILITITVVGIIAGVSLGFFKQQEPDKRIYDSTVRQLSSIVGAISYKACSDDLMCWDGNRIITPICPQYDNDNVPFVNNQCIHEKDAGANVGAECNNGAAGNYVLSNGQCTAIPQCASGNLVNYSSVFCPNFVSDLSTQVVVGQNGGNNVQGSFLCDQMFSFLSQT